MDLLWPDLGPEAAAANLRKVVHFARQALASEEHLRLRYEVLCLEAPHLWIDVDAFEAAAEAGDLQGAVELYGGDLLTSCTLGSQGGCWSARGSWRRLATSTPPRQHWSAWPPSTR